MAVNEKMDKQNGNKKFCEKVKIKVKKAKWDSLPELREV